MDKDSTKQVRKYYEQILNGGSVGSVEMKYCLAACEHKDYRIALLKNDMKQTRNTVMAMEILDCAERDGLARKVEESEKIISALQQEIMSLKMGEL